MPAVTDLRERYDAAATRVRTAADSITGAADDADLEGLQAELDEAEADAQAARTALTTGEAAERARAAHPAPDPLPDDQTSPAPHVTRSEAVYRPDGGHSYFQDLLRSRAGDPGARERLERNHAMRIDGDVIQRDMSTTAGAGGDFLPPLYLAGLYARPNIAARPFADAIPSAPLPDSGVTISIPKLGSGVSVATRADLGAVSETDGVTSTVSHIVTEIAGQVDIGRIDVMRSFPGMDMIIMETLVRRHAALVDNQALNGTGTAPQHTGIRAVAGVNAVSYTDATPTAAELVPKVYDAIQRIATNRLEDYADTIVMHPRRAAWLASNLSSTFPLFQLGGLNQAGGTQDRGFTDNFAGLRVILDPQVLTNLGAGTNEDEIYVLAINDLRLMEGPLFTRVFEDVGSGNGIIRYQVFSHNAFISKRYPESISIISGTGLITPAF